jgi:hypothetical protein
MKFNQPFIFKIFTDDPISGDSPFSPNGKASTAPVADVLVWKVV